MDAPFITSLIGPFAEWAEAPVVPPEYAHIVTRRTDARARAMERAKIWEEIHSAYEWPVNSNAGQYIGIIIDTHMKLITYRARLTVVEAYGLSLAPEQQPLESIVSDIFMPVTSKLVELLWSPHVDESTNVALAPHVRPQKRVKRSRGTKPKHPSYFTVRQDEKTALKLLAKGMPSSVSHRSVKKLLVSTTSYPVDNAALVYMLKLFALGAYRHSTIIAPLWLRIKLYGNRSAYHLSDIVSRFKTKCMYLAVSEFNIALARSHESIHYLLRCIDGWDEYTASVIENCNTRIRLSVYTNTPCPPITTNQLCLLSKEDVLTALAKVFGVKTRISRRDISVIGSLSRLRSVFRKHGSSILLALADLGVGKADVSKVSSIMATAGTGSAAKKTSAATKLLKPRTCSIMSVYIYMLLHKRTMRIFDVFVRRPFSKPSYGMVCADCFSLRSQADGAMNRTPVDGIYIDTLAYKVVCTSCRSRNIHAVCMKTHRIVATSSNSPVVPSLHVMCANCSNITVYGYVIGQHELCFACYTRAKSLLVPKHCVCGRVIEEHDPADTFVATSENGIQAMYAVCVKHRSVMKHYHGPSQEVATLKMICLYTEDRGRKRASLKHI